MLDDSWTGLWLQDISPQKILHLQKILLCSMVCSDTAGSLLLRQYVQSVLPHHLCDEIEKLVYFSKMLGLIIRTTQKLAYFICTLITRVSVTMYDQFH